METTAKFGTGAVRSGDAEDVRYDLISPIAMEALAQTYAEGASKYSDFNWEKGMPAHDLLNHALRHVFKFLSGDRSEPHLPHAMWNLGAAIHSVALWPHLNSDKLRGPGCTPPTEPPQADPVGGQTMQDSPVLPLADATQSTESTHSPLGNEVVLNDVWHGKKNAGLTKDQLEILKPSKHDESRTFHPACDAYGEGASALQGIVGSPARKTLTAYMDGGSTAPSRAVDDDPKPVLYLSGPMTGFEHYNFPAFNQAANHLRGMGYPVLNPADFGAKPGHTWEAHLQRDLFVLGHADIVIQLPDWERSRGASLEHTVAVQLGKQIISYDDFTSTGIRS